MRKFSFPLCPLLSGTLIFSLMSSTVHAQFDSIRADQILSRHAPDQFEIIKKYMSYPASLASKNDKGYTIKTWKTGGAHSYLEYNDLNDFLGSMETNVHEICHSVTHYGIYDYLSHHQLNFNPGHLQYYFYLKPGTDFFIEMPDEFFPSAKLAVEIPVARRTFRFKTYITGTSSTQAHGLLGLLNEFNAYYHGFKTQWNLRPAYIEMFDDPVNGYVRWINRCSSLAEAYYEFRFFILEYLRMARVVYPKLYDRIRRNPTIATVFNSISNEFKVTVRLYQMEIDSGYRKFAAENNCTVSLEPKIGSVFFWRAGHSSASGFYQEMKNYEKVKDVLSSDRYSMVMKELGLQ